jgi:hypothetical protein
LEAGIARRYNVDEIIHPSPHPFRLEAGAARRYDVNWTEFLCHGALRIAVVTMRRAPAGIARL